MVLNVEVHEELVSALPEYEKVPIVFRVTSHLDILPIENGLGGFSFVENVVPPYTKDYDATKSERPTQWPTRFDMSHWGIFSAFNGRSRLGGAAVAWKTPGINWLDKRQDLACLWDLRVHP